MAMLPAIHVNDAGNATAGTIFGGPFTGPDTVQETNLAFFDITRDVTLQDAVAQLASGAAAVQGHAYLLAVDDVNAVVAVVQASELQPASIIRSVPALKFKAGQRLFVRAVQLSGTAAEATILMLRWAPSAQPTKMGA